MTHDTIWRKHKFNVCIVSAQQAAMEDLPFGYST